MPKPILTAALITLFGFQTAIADSQKSGHGSPHAVHDQGDAPLLKPDDAAIPLLRLLDRLSKEHEGEVPLSAFLRVPGMQLGEGRGANRFRTLDANRDGLVSANEVKALIVREIKGQEDRMLALDADGDGMLSMHEFALSLPNRGERAETPDGKPLRANDFLATRFGAYDSDGDRRISREEVVQFVTTSALARSWANSTMPRLQVIDVNRDNYIDKAEFAVFDVGLLLVMADNRGGPGGTPRIKTAHPEKVPIERMTRNLLRLDAAARRKVDRKLDELENRPPESAK